MKGYMYNNIYQKINVTELDFSKLYFCSNFSLNSLIFFSLEDLQ